LAEERAATAGAGSVTESAGFAVGCIHQVPRRSVDQGGSDAKPL